MNCCCKQYINMLTVLIFNCFDVIYLKSGHHPLSTGVESAHNRAAAALAGLQALQTHQGQQPSTP